MYIKQCFIIFINRRMRNIFSGTRYTVYNLYSYYLTDTVSAIQEREISPQDCVAFEDISLSKILKNMFSSLNDLLISSMFLLFENFIVMKAMTYSEFRSSFQRKFNTKFFLLINHSQRSWTSVDRSVIQPDLRLNARSTMMPHYSGF